MSTSYYASAVVGIVLPIKKEDFQYTIENRGCDHILPDHAKFCPDCGNPKTVNIVEEIDIYELEELIVKSKLQYSPTTDYIEFAIGVSTKDCNLAYGGATNSIDIPDTYFIANELLSIKESISKHPLLSKTNLTVSFQKAINEGIKIHSVGYCSY